MHKIPGGVTEDNGATTGVTPPPKGQMLREEDRVIYLEVIYGQNRQVLALTELSAKMPTVHGERDRRVGEMRGPGGEPQGDLVQCDVQAAHKAKVLTNAVPRTSALGNLVSPG